MSIKVGNHILGVDHPVYFIADIASNHNGDLSHAKELIVKELVILYPENHCLLYLGVFLLIQQKMKYLYAPHLKKFMKIYFLLI